MAQPTPPPSTVLAPLKDGQNYKVIPGKHFGSQLVVKGKYAFNIQKRRKDGASEIIYLRCKFKGCPSRAHLKDDFFYEPNADKTPHSCDQDGNGPSEARWMAQAALGRMKERAAKETSTFEVRTMIAVSSP